MSGDRAGQSGWLKRVGLLPGLVISGGCLVLLLWNVEWTRLWAVLEGADYWWLLLSLVFLSLAVGFKVLRWRQLLAPACDCSRPNLFYSISVGYLVNTILPGRLGELARVYLLARLEKVSLAAVLSTVVVDRLLDIVVLSLMLAVVLPFTDLPEWVSWSGVGLGGAGVAMLLLCILLAHPAGRGFFLKLLDVTPSFPGKSLAQKWAGELCLGVEGLRGAGPLVRVSVTSLAIWLATVLVFYFGQLAFHIRAPIASAALVTALTSMGMVVPSSPGYLGVFHYLVVLGMDAFGVEKEAALGFAIAIHLEETLLLGLMGTFSLWRCGLTLMSWREVPSGVEAEA